jgi:hypothetical protein
VALGSAFVLSWLLRRSSRPALGRDGGPPARGDLAGTRFERADISAALDSAEPDIVKALHCRLGRDEVDSAAVLAAGRAGFC